MASSPPPPPPLNKSYLVAPRTSFARRSSAVSVALVDDLFSDAETDTKTDTYGVSELRDGFFDALFTHPAPLPRDELLAHAKETLPRDFDKHSPLSPKHFVPRQWYEIKSLARRIGTTREGIRLFRSFLAFFVAYVLCLIPKVAVWLGRYNYIMVVSVIINHPARAIGSQLDGALLTSIGTAAGLGWGAIGLLLSTSTIAASAAYGGILALFLLLFMAIISWIRSFFSRSYQAVLCAGIAITFTTLAESNSRDVRWEKLLSYAVPWFLGQAIALVVNLLIFPDFGSRRLATNLHDSFDTMQAALEVPRPRNTRLRRRLARTFVNLSQAYRDLRLDLTITRFQPDDFRDLRNLMQACIRSLLAMETETSLFDKLHSEDKVEIDIDEAMSPNEEKSTAGEKGPHPDDDNIRRVIQVLSEPTRELLECMREGLRRCDAALMDLSGHRHHLGPSKTISADVGPIQIRMKLAQAAFDTVETSLLTSNDLSPSSIHDTGVVQLFMFARHVREAANSVENLMAKAHVMQLKSDWPKLYLPSYPFWKAIHRTNVQVRHDRGGIVAGSYQVTFNEISRLLDKIKSREHKPPASDEVERTDTLEYMDSVALEQDAAKDNPDDHRLSSKKDKLGYRVWAVLHQLQGYQSRYALKVCLVTSLLSVPAYLPNTSVWWNRYEAWWAVSLSWIMMHPRVGGNLQDLVTRSLVVISGAVWSGAAYAAGDGNPYVLAAFATVYMIPMLYRYTQSSHPRSGLGGCLSFTIISLSLRTNNDNSIIAILATLKGIVFLVGTTAPILVTWILWPFVARHELRYALSSMLFFMSIMYRNIVAKYVYFEEGKAPTPEDIERSEMLEGRLREGFVRIRQLLVLTRHEIRLRAPFDPLPYSALSDALERFFEYIIALRQSALFYSPSYVRRDPIAAKRLLPHRRDAVAAILGNLYILAGALRSKRPVPRYLPSAVAARKRLLLRTVEVEAETARTADDEQQREQRKWSDMYSYSYNESLTGCVAQLEELEKYTKLVVGEQGFDDGFEDLDSSDDEH